MFPKYDKKQFANVVTGDETWIHYFEPVRRVSNKIWATKHSKRPIIAKRSLSIKKVLYAIFFSGEGIAIKVPVKKGKSIHRKVLQRRSTEETEKVLSETTPCHWFLTCPSSTWQCPSSYLRNTYGVFEERKSNCFASPPVFPRPCPMWFLFVSEIESIPCWAEIPVPTGTWICHSSVPYYCAQISVPWRLQEVDTSAETLHF